jgi:recombination protein RecA
MYNEGISKVGGLLDVGVDTEIITKRGSYYYFGEDQLGQGRENAKDFLREHQDFAEEIEAQIRETVGLTTASDESDDQEE